MNDRGGEYMTKLYEEPTEVGAVLLCGAVCVCS